MPHVPWRFLFDLEHQLEQIMTALSDLQAAVAAEETEEAAVLTYLQGVPGLISAAVAAGNTDGPALEALAAQITSDTGNLTAGVAAAPSETAGNTTAAPVAPAVPPAGNTTA